MEPGHTINEQVMLSLVDYIPIKGILALSLTSSRTHSSREFTGTIRHKYALEDDVLFTSRERRAHELNEAIKSDDLHKVELIIAYRPTVGDTLIPHVLQLAAIYTSKRVFTGIAPMMTQELNSMLVRFVSHVELIDYLFDLTLAALETNDPDIYESFFSALEGTTYGAKSLLFNRVLGPVELGRVAWYSYGTGSRASEIFRKHVKGIQLATREEAYGLVNTPTIVKDLAEFDDESLEVLLEKSHSDLVTKYALGDASYEDVIKEHEMNKLLQADVVVQKIVILKQI